MSTSKPADKAPAKLTFPQQFIAGGVAGVSEIIIMYPLDVVKTRAQLNVGQNLNMFKTLSDTIKADGLKIYRGIASPILVEAPKRAVKFAANEKYRELFKDKNGRVGQAGSIGAGVMAGITEAFLVVPFELVKIRLQAKENAGLYKNTTDCVQKILQTEGPLAFFKGLEATLWRHALWNGGFFGVIHKVREMLPQSDTPSGEMARNFIAGSLAGTFGTILNTPADVVKTRIQNVVPGTTSRYTWAVPSMAIIAKEEGVAALWKGFFPKVMRLGPGGGILLVVFEVVSGWFRKYNESRV